MIFDKESDFEDALVEILHKKYRWEANVLNYNDERQLIENWKTILFENNREIDRLNGVPLTDTEMGQILDQVKKIKHPIGLNRFINGKSISIVRDNPNDAEHCGKTVSLKIYDRNEIAAGHSRYQIARQPRYSRIKEDNATLNLRGDITLLINGMPVIHIELKNSGIPVSQAVNQIKRYLRKGVFSGFFSLVQVFVAMTPDETLYFANPGPDKLNMNLCFHWADFNNEPINDWTKIAEKLLSIPMAHQLIGFYTVPDDTDGTLKVMRSYQYYAVWAISDRITNLKWGEDSARGGHVWHTTGSGKTLTSFKSAQLIANSNDADKVVFLMDRIELGMQSLREYNGFKDESESIQGTENSAILLGKLKSDDASDTLIVTSIQKMSRIKAEGSFNAEDIEKINEKRIVFIVDECHRSTFGEMLRTIKDTFPRAIFFGFTGTPIHDENKKKDSTTAQVFGDELHRYSIADGIGDRNVLGFDTYKISTYKNVELRKKIALQKAKAATEAEARANPDKAKIYRKFMSGAVKMAGCLDSTGKYQEGIEDFVGHEQYDSGEQGERHRAAVVKDILDNWNRLSMDGKFHAIFATSSIIEAIEYYRLLKKRCADPNLNLNLNISALFDPSDGDDYDAGKGIIKEDELAEIINDYNVKFDLTCSPKTFKTDLCLRLAHKGQYTNIDKERQIDIVIVVNQLLTGFDSKWINTIYLDKMLEREHIIQAFSRTNRLFGHDKLHGIVRYYRKPHTMEKNIQEAFEQYSGNKMFGIFVDKLKENLVALNRIFGEIKDLFNAEGICDFKENPDSIEAKRKFAKCFRELNQRLEAAKIQGFAWNKLNYKSKYGLIVECDKQTYLALAQRYKELYMELTNSDNAEENKMACVPYDIDTDLIELDSDTIDFDYMNSKFTKYLKALESSEQTAIKNILDELHGTFAALSKERQKFADILLHNIQRGDIIADPHKSFTDYITEYMAEDRRNRITQFADELGVDAESLLNFMNMRPNKQNIDDFGRFTDLKNSVDRTVAKRFFEKKEGKSISDFDVSMKIDKYLREFILGDRIDN